MLFEWNDEKDRLNQKKHFGISFSDAREVFNDPRAITLYDSDHSEGEDRWVILGRQPSGSVLVVSFTIRQPGERIRIISARHSDIDEEIQYYQG